MRLIFVVLFVCLIDFLSPINNLSVIKGRFSWVYLCCIFIIFSRDHSIYVPHPNYLNEPFHSRTKERLSLQIIPFTDHSIHRPNSNYFYGPFHPWSIPIHGPFTDQSRRHITYRLTPHTAMNMSTKC